MDDNFAWEMAERALTDIAAVRHYRRYLEPSNLFGWSPRGSPEVPSERSAQQRFDFTSRQRSSILIAPMFDPPPYASRITVMALEAQAAYPTGKGLVAI
ncbi:hypothetical protein B5K11_26545 [Rhizobium leguminosarum bv. trifolii]|uniref:hypothetical protein n=1 Tax=Rhizobium leguminosarum TaxID=384 RepID=UPI000E2E639D|nr:hypothetical protein [Rhizobium leguminosarum]RFB87703.1 hypothetical protein B5K11_26545 [Rhizobium leguminosarum bv. trifolii]